MNESNKESNGREENEVRHCKPLSRRETQNNNEKLDRRLNSILEDSDFDVII